MTKFFLSIILFSFIPVFGNGQTIKGKIIDPDKKGIAEAIVILQRADSTFIKAVSTDSTGNFSFILQTPEPPGIRLVIQHILYYPKSMIINKISKDSLIISLEEKTFKINELAVKSSAPHFKIQDNKLIFNANNLLKNTPVSNAMDVIKQTPGILFENSKISLIGSEKLSIIINGKKSTLTQEQIISLLNSMPASDVKEVEIMYNPPAKYNLRGAAVNITTSAPEENSNRKFRGEAGVRYNQAFYGNGEIRGNILYSYKKVNIDALIAFSSGDKRDESTLFSKYTFNNILSAVEQNNIIHSDFNNLIFRLGTNLKTGKTGTIDLSYYYNGNGTDSESNTRSILFGPASSQTFSTNEKDGKSRLHNAHLEYDNSNNTLGIDFTSYRNTDKNIFNNYKTDLNKNEIRNNAVQDISQMSIYGNKKHRISAGFTFNYGLNFSYNFSKTRIGYFYQESSGANAESFTNQKEYIGNVYIELTNKWGKNISSTLSLKIEYFNSKYEGNRTNRTLWNKWTFYPNLTLSFPVNNKHSLQLNITSDKKYPSYWSVSPQVTYVDAYTEIVGNPMLQPGSTYRSQLIYILNRKYIFTLFASYSHLPFTQLPYQHNDITKTIYRYENLDFSLRTGIGAVIPFKIGNWLTSRVSVQGFRAEDKKKDFHGINFTNKRFICVANMSNTFTISAERPNISLLINFLYQSPAIQGIYRLGNIYNLSSSVKWNIFHRCRLLFECSNILKRQSPYPIKIDISDQYSRRRIIGQRTFSIELAYSFGNYTKSKYKNIDKSRLEKK